MTDQLPTLVLMSLPHELGVLPKSSGAPVVSIEAVRFAVHGQEFIEEAEPYVWMVARHMVTALFYAGHERVVVTDPAETKERRVWWRSKRWRLAAQNFPVEAAG